MGGPRLNVKPRVSGPAKTFKCFIESFLELMPVIELRVIVVDIDFIYLALWQNGIPRSTVEEYRREIIEHGVDLKLMYYGNAVFIRKMLCYRRQ
jgi:hypothetical protein